MLTTTKDFTVINLDRHVEISYSRVDTHLLGNGFDTNCFDYNLDHKFANYNMRSDSMLHCMRKQLKSPPNQLVISHYPMRKEYFQHNLKIDPDMFHEWSGIDINGNEFEWGLTELTET